MRRRQVYQKSLAELQVLPTRQLLVRLKHLQRCEQSRALSDRDGPVVEPDGRIEFKDAAEWQVPYQQVKEVLATREHIAKGEALLERRQQRTQQNKVAEKRVGRGRRY